MKGRHEPRAVGRIWLQTPAGRRNSTPRARANASLARARAQGKTLGRPKVDAATEARIRTLRAAGHGINKFAKMAGVGISAVHRIIAAG
jgi:DNA invertase Pin-like site-specific DNA recombinase